MRAPGEGRDPQSLEAAGVDRRRRDAEILAELQRLRAEAERIGLTTALPALNEALRPA